MSGYIEKRKNHVIISESLHKPMFHIFINNAYGPHLLKPTHFHIDIEIMIIKSGRGKMRCNDDIINVETGDVFLFRSMEPHYIFEVESKYPLKYISFSFSKNILLSEKEGWIDKSFLNIIEDKNENFVNKLDLDNKSRSVLKKLISDIEYELGDDNHRNSYVIKCKFLEILTRISNGYALTPHKPLGNFYHKDINRSIIYMNQHLADPITLEDLAEVAQMGVSHYCAMFKKLMGISPWRFFLEHRVNLAIKYLTDPETNYKITKISSLCGFNNTVNFNKVFKNITGKTPSEYRKNII
ncbi:MAG: helix-turn-helix transcriptional regulator [Clostridia bacterium]|nr:helix-turn-helix transcriptional regulator [Clostridia bacterium]